MMTLPRGEESQAKLIHREGSYKHHIYYKGCNVCFNLAKRNFKLAKPTQSDRCGCDLCETNFLPNLSWKGRTTITTTPQIASLHRMQYLVLNEGIAMARISYLSKS